LVDGAIEFRATDFLAKNVLKGLEDIDSPIRLSHDALYSALTNAERICDNLTQPSLTIPEYPSDFAVEESPVSISPEELASSDERVW
jgi:hypothetical protein